jgi:hypothetical protein
MSDLFNVTFKEELNLTALSIDSAATSYIVYFTDGTNKNFSVSYSGSGTVQNSTIRAYPNFASAQNISSSEIYSKSGYTTRSRFMQFASTPMGTRQDISVYMLASGSASYGIIYVHDSGDPVEGAYIQILKYYASSSQYLNIEQKVTNNEGKAPIYYQDGAYYKFYVYDSDGGLLYASSQPEQFICDTTCIIEINLDTSADSNFIKPYMTANCYGNETSNSIVYSYADVTGLTHSISYLAWRGSSAVCNSTVSASSGSYICALSAPENLSNYLYTCEIRASASPDLTYFVGMLDFRDIIPTDDWLLVGIAAVVVVGTCFFNPALGIGVLGVSLVALSQLGFIDITEGAAIMIFGAGGLLAFIMLREGN